MSARRDWRAEPSGPTSESLRARVLDASSAGATGFESPDDGRWIGAVLTDAPPQLLPRDDDATGRESGASRGASTPATLSPAERALSRRANDRW